MHRTNGWISIYGSTHKLIWSRSSPCPAWFRRENIPPTGHHACHVYSRTHHLSVFGVDHLFQMANQGILRTDIYKPALVSSRTIFLQCDALALEKLQQNSCHIPKEGEREPRFSYLSEFVEWQNGNAGKHLRIHAAAQR